MLGLTSAGVRFDVLQPLDRFMVTVRHQCGDGVQQTVDVGDAERIAHLLLEDVQSVRTK